MLIRIEAGDDRPIYIQITDEVRRALVLGTLRPDEPLPSVRELAAELRINPNTVQQAYRELERDGLVYVRRGQGTFAASLDGGRGTQRARLAAEVAERALREAYRNGVAPGELIDAIRAAAAESPGDARGGGGAAAPGGEAGSSGRGKERKRR